MPELNDKTIEQISTLARSGIGPQVVPGGIVPYVLVPPGHAAVPMPDLVWNDHQATPERIREKVGVFDAASFVEYFNLFSDPNSRIFADETKLSVLAVLDYHGAKEGAPRWGQHRLTLTLRQSEEWKIWMGHNNKQFNQQQFAEFLEQHSIDVTNPAPAAMMDIASDLQATNEVDFGSSLRQQDGQVRFKYTETLKTTVGSGTVTVPDRFTITIPAFVGGDPVAMNALLRFRLKDAKLTFWYTLIRPEEVIRTAFLAARGQIADALGIGIINGSPA